MQTNNPPTEDLIDAEQLAARLGVSKRYVRRMIEERRIPFHKIGRYVRFRPTDVDDYLASRRVESTIH